MLVDKTSTSQLTELKSAIIFLEQFRFRKEPLRFRGRVINNKMKFLVVLLLVLTTFSISARAHRYHTSLTRIDYNADEQIAEITLQLFSDDFEAALTRKTGKPVNLDKTLKLDEIILSYLSDRFVIKNKSGETKKLRYIGFERTNDAFRLYIEATVPEGLDGATLENTVLFDQFDDQTNLVTSRFNSVKTDLVFRPNDKAQALTKKVQQNGQ